MSVSAVVGALLPERAIIVDESNTAGITLAAATAGAPAHDVLTLTGGAIGYGLPTAVGAAIAAPDRPVLSLQADGSAMYTISALWTQAREKLDITTVILNNGAYDILRIELARVGAENAATPGPKARDLLDLGRPALDFVKLAEGRPWCRPCWPDPLVSPTPKRTFGRRHAVFSRRDVRLGEKEKELA